MYKIIINPKTGMVRTHSQSGSDSDVCMLCKKHADCSKDIVGMNASGADTSCFVPCG